MEQYSCPNPQCLLSFASNEQVCDHLMDPGTVCGEQVRDLLDNLAIQASSEGHEEDEEETEGMLYCYADSVR